MAKTEFDQQELMHWMEERVAKWWLPDDIVTVDELPHTATGKLDKKVLRKDFADYQFPNS